MVAEIKDSSALEWQAHLKWQWQNFETSKSAVSDTLSPPDRTS